MPVDDALLEADRLLEEQGRLKARIERYERIDAAAKQRLADRFNTTVWPLRQRYSDLETKITQIHQAVRESGGSPTYKLPHGDLKSSRGTKWFWPTGKQADAAITATLLDKGTPKGVRTTHEVARDDLKSIATIKDGKVYVPSSTGELVLVPGVTVKLNNVSYSAHPSTSDFDWEEPEAA